MFDLYFKKKNCILNFLLFETEIYTPSESWINRLSIDVLFCFLGYDSIWIQLFENLESECAKISQIKVKN